MRRKLRRENTRIKKFKYPKDVKMQNPIIELFKNQKKEYAAFENNTYM